MAIALMTDEPYDVDSFGLSASKSVVIAIGGSGQDRRLIKPCMCWRTWLERNACGLAACHVHEMEHGSCCFDRNVVRTVY